MGVPTRRTPSGAAVIRQDLTDAIVEAALDELVERVRPLLLRHLLRQHDEPVVLLSPAVEVLGPLTALEDALGRDKARTIAVVATGDESAMMRRLAPKAAMCIAEHLRDRGENVLLIVDSVTRFAHAARDVALSAGEPPVARGYPPSVFSDLPRLLERAGPGEEGTGSITGVFAVLVDGDDL